MRVTVTGASGFIGRRLVESLLAAGHELHLLGRALRKGMPSSAQFSIWDPMKGEPPAQAIENAHAVIHLAGEPIAQRWTAEAKRKIRNSRVAGTANLAKAIAGAAHPPHTFICASAIGIYGDRGSEILTEESGTGSDFLAQVGVDWERAAEPALKAARVVWIRTGLVLGEDGGLLERLLPPFRLGVGGKLGTGEQWMSWIHIDDLTGLILFALENPAVAGPVNATVPEPVTNADFTQALARALRRPAIFPVPIFAIRLLFGEMADVIVSSQRVLPKAAEAAGYRFQFTEVQPALQSILSPPAK
jgi:hypothetical protein